MKFPGGIRRRCIDDELWSFRIFFKEEILIVPSLLPSCFYLTIIIGFGKFPQDPRHCPYFWG